MKVPKKNYLESAFSLVEITLALGVAAFALVALLGLLSTGLRVSGQSQSSIEAAHTISGLIATRRAVPYGTLSTDFPLPALDQAVPNGQAFLDRQGRVVTSKSKAYYSLIYRITPSASLATSQLYLSLAHPPVDGTDYAALNRVSEHLEILTYVSLSR